MSCITVTMLEDILAYVKTIVPEVECQRSYIPEQSITKLAAMGKPLLSIILDDRDGTRETRGDLILNTFIVDIVVQKKLNAKSNAEIDPCIEIVERLFNVFLAKVVFSTNGKKYFCSQPLHGDDAPFIVGMQLIENNCFFGMVSIEVKVNTNACN